MSERFVVDASNQGAIWIGLSMNAGHGGFRCADYPEEQECTSHARNYGFTLDFHWEGFALSLRLDVPLLQPMCIPTSNAMRHNLSDTTALLRDRRSIKPEAYSARKVHPEIVEQVLTNATWAPTHGMTQPWRFKAYVGDGMQAIGPKLAAWYRAAAGDSFSEAKHAKLKARGERVTALVVLGMEPDSNGRIPIQDERMAVACAVQNMYLTCTAHGIGGFWSTPSYMNLPEVKAFAGLSEPSEILGFFYLGYPDGGEWPRSHRKPLEYVSEWITEAK